MMISKHLYTISVPSTEFESGGAYMVRGTIRYEYYRGGAVHRSGIRFKRVYATRTRAESCCKVCDIEGAYDTLVEVMDSKWVPELQTDTIDRQLKLGEEWEMHHYMIYLDSSGCFEVVAESWETLPEEVGSWNLA